MFAVRRSDICTQPAFIGISGRLERQNGAENDLKLCPKNTQIEIHQNFKSPIEALSVI